MNTLRTRAASDLDAELTTHPPTAFAGRPTPAERLQLRIGLWLIRRATAPARPKRDLWASHLAAEHARTHRERETLRYAELTRWR